jgi:hypothetical protein
LRELHLGHNGIGFEGAVALARSSHLAGLLALDLRRAEIGSKGGQALAASPCLKQIAFLDVAENGLDEASKDALRQRFGARAQVTLPWEK